MRNFLSRLKGMHDTLIAVSARTRQTFRSLNEDGKLHCRVRAADVRHLLLLLPFAVYDLFSSEVKAWNAVPGNQQIQDPSPEIVAICLSLVEWYHLYRRSGHTTEDIYLLERLGASFMDRCAQLFPFRNSKGHPIMGTDKVHFMKHGATQILNWGNIINCSAEPSEITHKIWVKGQGDNTNQGPSSAKTMMRHSQSKAAAQECAHAIAGMCSRDHYIAVIAKIGCFLRKT
jgi:hypothetical protein